MIYGESRRICWPWQKRVEEAAKAAERAREELAQVRAHRPEVIITASRSRQHRELNGWTARIKNIMTS